MVYWMIYSYILMAILVSHVIHGQAPQEKCDSNQTCYFSLEGTRSHYEAALACGKYSAQLISRNQAKFLADNNTFTRVLGSGIWFNNIDMTVTSGHQTATPSTYNRTTTRPPQWSQTCLVLDLATKNLTLVTRPDKQCKVMCSKDNLAHTSSIPALVTTHIVPTGGVTKEPSSSKQNNKNIPIIVGVVIATVVICAIISIVVAIFVYRRRKSSPNQSTGITTESRALSNQYEDLEGPFYDNPQQPIYAVSQQNGNRNQNQSGNDVGSVQPNGIVIDGHLYDNPQNPGASISTNGGN